MRVIHRIAMVVSAVALLMAGTGYAETTQKICKEIGSKVEFKLQFRWPSTTADGGTVDISYRHGSGDYTTIFKGADAARGMDQQKGFLVEATSKHYVGPTGTGCGAMVETLDFDVMEANGTEGTVTRSSRFLSKQGNCRIRTPAPEIVNQPYKLKCS